MISDLENPSISIFMQFDRKNLEFIQQWLPYCIRYLKFFIFEIVIGDLKNLLRLIFVRFVKNGRYIIFTIFNFLILTAQS